MTGGRGRHVLHVFATFSRGGPQVRAAQLMERMGSGFRHTVVAMDRDFAARELVTEGVDLELREPPPASGFLAMGRRLTALLHESGPDLLLTYNWGAIEAVWAACRAGFGALVHHEEGFGPQELRRRLLRRNWARRLLLRRARAVVVPSHGLMRIARKEWRLPADRVRHLPNGVDLERFRPRPRPREGPPALGTVGRLRPEKDHALLLRAFARLSDASWRLHLVGDGPLDGELRNLAETLEVRDRVEFHGPVLDPARAYHEMEFFVLPSRTEQMPLSLLEAMASGLPVAATDVGDVRAMLPPECRGGLVPAGDEDALAAAIEALAGDPGRRAREGERNRGWCVEHYELGACLDRYVELYESVLGAAVRR